MGTVVVVEVVEVVVVGDVLVASSPVLMVNIGDSEGSLACRPEMATGMVPELNGSNAMP